jgi:hypothetical protein
MRTIILLLCAGATVDAWAVDPPEVFATTGAVKGYLDEPFKFAGGAGARIPFFDRLALRPEFLVANDPRFSHRYVLGSVTYDVNDPRRTTALYLVGGGGWVSVRDRAIPYSFGEGEFVGGAGFRFALGERVTFSTEFRAGKSALPLVTAQIGFRLGKRR